MTTKSRYGTASSDGRLHNLWHRVTGYRFLNRKNQGQEWRARATIAWKARLPASRSTDDIRRTAIRELNANPQLGSLFFRKLPLEIRRQIYTEILGYEDFVFCLTNEDTSLNGNELGKEQIPFDFRCHGAQGFLSLLMSCKSAYLESHSLLYTNNTFRLSGLTEYACLTRLVSKHNLDLIRNLYVQWSYEAAECERDFLVGIPPYHVGFWTETWNAISEWKSLKHVRVDIHKWQTNPCIMAYQEGAYLAPLKVLGDQVQLEVCVSWDRWEADDGYAQPPDGEKWPFVIRRGMKICEDDTERFKLAARA